MASSAEEFYDAHWLTSLHFGVVLPYWNELSWDEQIDWEDRFAEQMNRDKELDYT